MTNASPTNSRLAGGGAPVVGRGLGQRRRAEQPWYDSVGFRVPLLVISPYAKKNYDIFGLARLAAADRREVAIPIRCTQYFINEEPDDRIPDAQ